GESRLTYTGSFVLSHPRSPRGVAVYSFLLVPLDRGGGRPTFAAGSRSERSSLPPKCRRTQRFSTDLSISGTNVVRGRISVVRAAFGRTRMVASLGPKPPALSGSSSNS